MFIRTLIAPKNGFNLMEFVSRVLSEFHQEIIRLLKYILILVDQDLLS